MKFKANVGTIYKENDINEGLDSCLKEGWTKMFNVEIILKEFLGINYNRGINSQIEKRNGCSYNLYICWSDI